VFTAIDPVLPASISPRVHDEVLRGSIGYDGLVMSDDISMHALSGTFAERAAAVIAAGSDVVLHCNGEEAEMTAAASGVPRLAGAALARYARARAVTSAAPEPFDRAEAEELLDWVLAADGPPATS
jgi:beta-N-acetylhexosaminidase